MGQICNICDKSTPEVRFSKGYRKCNICRGIGRATKSEIYQLREEIRILEEQNKDLKVKNKLYLNKIEYLEKSLGILDISKLNLSE